MKRREFITLLGGAATWPRLAFAQQPERKRIVAFLSGGTRGDPEWQRAVRAFEQELERLGWFRGRNIEFEYRWYPGAIEQFKTVAAELVGLRPDLILTSATLAARALQAETRSIPIVFVNVADPVGSKLVPSLSGPEGNITGFTAYEYSISGKWLSIVKELDGRVRRVALLYNPDTAPYAPGFWHALEAAAQTVAVEPVKAPFRTPEEIGRVIEQFAREPGGGLLTVPEFSTITHRQRIIDLAARYRLPAVYGFRFFATDGGLAVYTFDLIDQYRRVAGYVDRILRGDKPADLPVQAPTKFELVINLKTAKALGLEIPATLLATADEVIE
jgi:putative tryptophan/tyrosine transport system substrate-binding protein